MGGWGVCACGGRRTTACRAPASLPETSPACCLGRITSTVACDMDLAKYPMDEQECMLHLESCECPSGGRDRVGLRSGQAVLASPVALLGEHRGLTLSGSFAAGLARGPGGNWDRPRAVRGLG